MTKTETRPKTDAQEKFEPKKYMIKLGSKDYLEVKFRLHWFRLDHPDWQIQTEIIKLDLQRGVVIVKAMILDEEGAFLSMGHKMEYQKNFFDFLEKAETGAIGRALAALGYGTLQCFDLDEGIEEGRIADAPVSTQNGKPVGSFNGNGKDARIISEKQSRRMFAIANGNKEQIDAIVKKYGYKSSKDIKRSDYEVICLELENGPAPPSGIQTILPPKTKNQKTAEDESWADVEPPPGF